MTRVTPGFLTLMVGPAGAGKTTWLASVEAARLGINAQHIVSSDQIRLDLLGDMLRQDRNDDVFAALHSVVKARIRSGLPAVVDATNLRDRDRKSIVDLTKSTNFGYSIPNS